MGHPTQLRLFDDPLPLLDPAEPDEEYGGPADPFDGREDVPAARHAFEEYLRQKGWPYVAVDTARRAIFAQPGMGDFDFLVYSASGPNLLVLLVGEEGLATTDVSLLEDWERVFNGGASQRDFQGCLVTFAGGKWRAVTVQEWNDIGWHPTDFDLLV
jgi:hypothetical protein